MTEAQWLACADPAAMLDHLDGLGGAPPERELRLFACACVRDIWRLVDEARSRAAVEVAERYADGEATDAEMMAARDAARDAAWAAAWAAVRAAARDAARAAAWAAAWAAARDAARARQADLLRDIFGDPLRPAFGRIIHSAWITPQVLTLAYAVYEYRDPDAGHLDPHRLAVLSDALEEAGCPLTPVDDCRECGGLGWLGRISLSERQPPSRPCPACRGGILDHLRSAGPHVRGCWALDLILGKR